MIVRPGASPACLPRRATRNFRSGSFGGKQLSRCGVRRRGDRARLCMAFPGMLGVLDCLRSPPPGRRPPAGASVIARSGRHAGGLAPMKVSARSVDGARSNPHRRQGREHRFVASQDSQQSRSGCLARAAWCASTTEAGSVLGPLFRVHSSVLTSGCRELVRRVRSGQQLLRLRIATAAPGVTVLAGHSETRFPWACSADRAFVGAVH